MKKVIVIPARLASTRLPRKVLLDLNGKTVLQRVYEQCIKVPAAEVYIATDSDEVLREANKFTENIVLTSKNHESGTDRIAEAIHNIDCDYVVNVQGDEPFIDPLLISQIFSSLEDNIGFKMVSVMERIDHVEDLNNPNVVKVVVNANKEALFFSRSIIPYKRDDIESISNHNGIIAETLNFYKHIGIYGYDKQFLIRFSQMELSYLEKMEKLEQLRVLESGEKIKMIETKVSSLGIDTFEDYKKALELVNNG